MTNVNNAEELILFLENSLVNIRKNLVLISNLEESKVLLSTMKQSVDRIDFSNVLCSKEQRSILENIKSEYVVLLNLYL